jgi:outer membrane PBP1 activator LpoA protein
MAWNDHMRDLTVVQSASALGRRAGEAFAAAWKERGGQVRVVEFPPDAGDPDALDALRASLAAQTVPGAPDAAGGSAIFLAADADEARRVRPYLGSVPTYATSRINDGRRGGLSDIDLDGIHFVDMPWLLEPDHPAVMVYPRPGDITNPDLQRLYALGIDACRLARIFVQGPPPDGRISLDGVTGALRLRASPGRPGRAVEREPLGASFDGNLGVAVDGDAKDHAAAP